LYSKQDQSSILWFKAEIAAYLRHQGKTEIRKRGSPSLSQVQLDIEVKKKPIAAPVPVQEIRTDETGHWPTFTEKRGRCKKPNCVGIRKVMCTKCKVHLCFTPSPNCFMEFHK